jgi:type I restriction enzyme, S subunit
MLVRKYDRYKPSGVDWLGEIPEEWKVTRVKNIFQLIIDPAPKNNSFELLSVYTDIGVKPRRELEERGNKASTTDGYWFVKKGDIVVNKLLAWMGAIGVSNYDGVTSPAYDILRAKVQIEPNFYHYLFRNEACISELKRNSRGIMEMRLRLYFDKFGDIIIPFPTYSNQFKIVKFLDEKTAKIDQAIVIKQKQIELLKERRQILIHKAVTRGLNPNVKLKDSGVDWIGEIPESWEVKRLKYVADLISLKKASKGNYLNYIGMENIESWTGKYISTETETEGLANYFKKGDILFGKLRPYLAKVYLAQNEGICSTEFLVYRSKEIIHNWYLNLIMQSFEFIKLIDSSTYGSKMPRANSDFIGNQLIPIPSEKEQSEIKEYIEITKNKIETAISFKEQEIERLKEYKSSLINSAVTGKIRV